MDSLLFMLMDQIQRIPGTMTDMDKLSLHGTRAISELKSMRKLYECVHCVLEARTVSVYHALAVLAKCHSIIQCTGEYAYTLDAMRDLVQRLDALVDDSPLDEYVSAIFSDRTPLLTRCIMLAFNDSVRHTNRFSRNLDSYNRTQSADAAWDATSVYMALEEVVEDFVHCDYAFSGIIIDGMRYLLHMIGAQLSSDPCWDWLRRETGALSAIVDMPAGVDIMGRRNAIVDFERECIVFNIHAMSTARSAMCDLLCKRIVRSYRYVDSVGYMPPTVVATLPQCERVYRIPVGYVVLVPLVLVLFAWILRMRIRRT